MIREKVFFYFTLMTKRISKSVDKYLEILKVDKNYFYKKQNKVNLLQLFYLLTACNHLKFL